MPGFGIRCCPSRCMTGIRTELENRGYVRIDDSSFKGKVPTWKLVNTAALYSTYVPSSRSRSLGVKKSFELYERTQS